MAVFLGSTGDEIDPDVTAGFLLFLGLLFCVRVVGQLVVRAKAPRWLPPMEQWNLLPYRFLLPIQVVFVAVIAAVISRLRRRPWFFARARIADSASSSSGSARSMRDRCSCATRSNGPPPGERWFGGTIPMVFHVVLAAFLFIWGTYDASY